MNPSPATERFWSTLLGYIREGLVIPIVGQDLITVEENGRSIRLTDAVAFQLAEELQEEGKLDPAPLCHETNTCELTTILGRLRDSRDRDDARARAHELIRDRARSVAIPESIRQLSEIDGFRLFVSTSVEGVLTRHLDDSHGGLLPFQRPVWYPGAEPGRADLDRVSPFDAPVVFHLFGQSSATPDTSALTEEETLEFITALQDPLRRPEKLFYELKRCHLLLLGNGFPDWLSRFFLRLLKDDPLALSTNRTSEYIAEPGTVAPGTRLAFFLERYSQKTRLCPCSSATDFVTDLHRRWFASQPSEDDARPGGVFISYSRQDLDTVQRLACRLDKAGIPFWFDKRELQPGDPFWQVIERNIGVSSVFLPILSATTRRRTEAHSGNRREIGFWREWCHAVDCAGLYGGSDGVLQHVTPVVVDPNFDNHIDYLPELFQQRNLAHAPGGDASDDLLRAINRQLRSKNLIPSP